MHYGKIYPENRNERNDGLEHGISHPIGRGDRSGCLRLLLQLRKHIDLRSPLPNTESMTRLPASPHMPTPDNTLNHEQFQVAVAEATRHFSLIRKKYPELKGYLVLSLLGEQTKINSSPKEVLSEFPSLVANNEAKTRMLRFLEAAHPKDETQSARERWQQQFQELSMELGYVGICQVAICFKDLKYDLIWKLQADELVDRDLTPQTKASIKIVLGTISHFSRTGG